MANRRANNSADVSPADYRAAALAYISSADDCYQATLASNPATLTQTVIIDQGPLYPPGTAGEINGQFVITDTKWPGEIIDPANPPQSPGGIVTYSFMTDTVSLTHEWPGITNTHVSSLVSSAGCDAIEEIETAFRAWEAVADIQFQQVTDSGLPGNHPNAKGVTGDIRIGAHTIFGIPNPLAHANIPPISSNDPNTIAGDIHFNTAIKNWACDPLDGFDIGLVALHEIGHAIGLAHEGPKIAVMNAPYNDALIGLQPDDINGAIAIYGEAAAAAVSTACALPVFSNDGYLGTGDWESSNNWEQETNGISSYLLASSNTPISSTVHLVSRELDTTSLRTLYFRHRFNTEQDTSTFFDGGRVEIKVGASNDWQPIDRAAFIKNGYNAKIAPILNSSLANQEVFAGNSDGFLESVIDLTNLVHGSNTFQFRFTFATDTVNRNPPLPNEGWSIDAVKVCKRIYFFPLLLKNGLG
ncbi:MAG: matrixin family metalloprotease [Anaerolineae bacterium]|nr:matrixin family metalloprotease [Anaerolineae bacterium]